MSKDTENPKVTGTVEEAFTGIYQHQRWGRGAWSGEGSDPTRLERYIRLLQQFIRERGITSVVDLGCGDWQFSRQIDWSGVNYIGIDVVPTLIQQLNTNYARNGVCFVHGNVVTCDLPAADLAISKDVLQHLPNELVLQFLGRLRRFKYAILTNDRKQYYPSWRDVWNFRRVYMTVPNSEISTGGYRPIRLREPPFNLKAHELLRLKMWHRYGVHLKEVLLWENKEMTYFSKSGNRKLF